MKRIALYALAVLIGGLYGAAALCVLAYLAWFFLAALA